MADQDNNIKQTAIAAEVGVSVSTVSRALASSSVVGNATRKRILEAAERLGYDLSQKKALGRAGTIVVCHSSAVSGLSGYYYLGFLEGTRNEMSQRGRRIELQLISAENESANQKVLAEAFENNPEAGCILLGQTSASLAGFVHQHKRPCVMLNAEVSDEHCDSFLPDNRLGGRLAADHLLDLGHKSFCIFSFPTQFPTLLTRQAGFKERLIERGIPEKNIETVMLGSNNPEVFEREFTAHFRENGNRHTALFCMNDIVAMGVWSGLRQVGLKVPADVSIVGFDNSLHGEMIPGGLTTIAVPCADIGRAAARQLLARKDEPEMAYQTVLFQPKLVERGSTDVPSKDG